MVWEMLYPRLFLLDEDYVIRLIVSGYKEDMGKQVVKKMEELFQ
ncbi:MAG: hypothetical protein RSC80_02585 [Odoribacter sp.]